MDCNQDARNAFIFIVEICQLRHTCSRICWKCIECTRLILLSNFLPVHATSNAHSGTHTNTHIYQSKDVQFKSSLWLKCVRTSKFKYSDLIHVHITCNSCCYFRAIFKIMCRTNDSRTEIAA